MSRSSEFPEKNRNSCRVAEKERGDGNGKDTDRLSVCFSEY